LWLVAAERGLWVLLEVLPAEYLLREALLGEKFVG
jgi:hypothetical protein